MELVTGTGSVTDVDGFLGDMTEIGQEYDCTIQAFDASYVAGSDHLRRAVELAQRSFSRGNNVARDRAVEVLLFAAGRRQIERALEMGIDEDETPMAIVVAATDVGDFADDGGTVGDRERSAAATIAAHPAFDPEDITLGDTDTLRDFFDITDTELEATNAEIVDLVLERVAMLAVEK